MNNLLFNLNKPIYAKDVETGKECLVSGIFLPLGKPSGKDISICVEDDLCEWRSIGEVELIQNE